MSTHIMYVHTIEQKNLYFQTSVFKLGLPSTQDLKFPYKNIISDVSVHECMEQDFIFVGVIVEALSLGREGIRWGTTIIQ